MKKFFLVILALCLMMGAAMAETNASVLSVTATEGCTVEVLESNAETTALMNDLYKFVHEEKKAPARFYDEATQKKLEELVDGIDIDLLNITDAMGLQLKGEPAQPVTVAMQMDVDYRAGQMIVAVLGAPQDNGEYAWFPYRGRVETDGEIKLDIPQEDWAALNQQPVSLQLMSDRVTSVNVDLWKNVTSSESVVAASKDSGDVIKTIRWSTEAGEPEANFSAWMSDLSADMEAEVARIGEHVASGSEILNYFPAQTRAEALELLNGADASALIPYDVIAMKVENYKDSYGDIDVEMLFGTAYQPEKAMVIMAGVPTEDASAMEWQVLSAEALESAEDHPVKIGLKQEILPKMTEEPVMLVIISEPIDQE